MLQRAAAVLQARFEELRVELSGLHR